MACNNYKINIRVKRKLRVCATLETFQEMKSLPHLRIVHYLLDGGWVRKWWDEILVTLKNGDLEIIDQIYWFGDPLKCWK